MQRSSSTRSGNLTMNFVQVYMYMCHFSIILFIITCIYNNNAYAIIMPPMRLLGPGACRSILCELPVRVDLKRSFQTSTTGRNILNFRYVDYEFVDLQLYYTQQEILSCYIESRSTGRCTPASRGVASGRYCTCNTESRLLRSIYRFSKRT